MKAVAEAKSRREASREAVKNSEATLKLLKERGYDKETIEQWEKAVEVHRREAALDEAKFSLEIAKANGDRERIDARTKNVAEKQKALDSAERPVRPQRQATTKPETTKVDQERIDKDAHNDISAKSKKLTNAEHALESAIEKGDEKQIETWTKIVKENQREFDDAAKSYKGKYDDDFIENARKEGEQGYNNLVKSMTGKTRKPKEMTPTDELQVPPTREPSLSGKTQAGGFSDSQRSALQSAKSKTEPPPGWEAKKINVGATEPHIWENKETGERMIVKDAGTQVWENIDGEELASEIFRESVLPNTPEVMLNDDRTTVGASFIGDRKEVKSYSTYKEMPFEEKMAILDDLENPDDAISLVISDLAIGNRDRNPGNIMFARKEDGSLEMIPIDHGWTFKPMPEDFSGFLHDYMDERSTSGAKIRDVGTELMLQQVSDMREGGASEAEIMAYVEGVYDKTIQQLKAVKPTKGKAEDRAVFEKNLAILASPEGKKIFMDRIQLATQEYAENPFESIEVARKRAEELNRANGFEEEIKVIKDAASTRTSGVDELNLPEEPDPALEAQASDAHDKFRDGFLLPDGSREVRMRKANPKDPNDETMVDINNTPYEDLPEHWKEQNRASGRSAKNAIEKVEADTGEPFDINNPEHMEAAASDVHDAWLKANSWRDDIPEGQQGPYEGMTEEEKEKDRIFVRETQGYRDRAAGKEAAPGRDPVTEGFASELHEAWRAPRKQDDGSFESRLKDDGKGGQVDIANTPYDELPEKWQAENRAASESALSRIKEVEAATGEKFDPDNPEHMEAVADGIHVDWLERNGSWAEEHQKLDYAELSEEEKQKDREMALAASKYRDSAGNQSASEVPPLVIPSNPEEMAGLKGNLSRQLETASGAKASALKAQIAQLDRALEAAKKK